MSRNGCIREYCNTWVYKMIDAYFRKAGTSKWIWNDAGARLNITAVGIASIAKCERFPSKPVFDRIVEMARPLGWTDADEIFGYIVKDFIIKNECFPSGWGNSGWGGFLISYMVTCVNKILKDGEELETFGEFNEYTRTPRSGNRKAYITIAKEDTNQKPGLSPKEFLEQNGWFNKDKDEKAAEVQSTPLEVKPLRPKPLGWGYDIAEHFPKYAENEADDHQEIDNVVEEGYNNLVNNREIVPGKPTLVHDKASNYDEFIDELCSNIKITDLAKCLYGSELDPEEFIQVYKMLTGRPETAKRETYVSYSYTGVNPVRVTLDEQLLNKIIVAVIRKVAQEIKDTDKED